MWGKKNHQFWLFVFLSWLSFPILAVWLMLTHPGKCAACWKNELTGSWFTKK